MGRRRLMLRCCTAESGSSSRTNSTSRPARELLIAAIAASLLLSGCVRWEHLAERMGGETRALPLVEYAGAEISTWALPKPATVMWLHTPVEIGRGEFHGRTAGLYVSAVAICDVFWDGQLIGTSREIDTFFALTKTQATEGSHILGVRVHPANVPVRAWFYGLALGDYRAMVRSRGASQTIPLLAVGAFLVVGVWYFVLWLSSRQRYELLVFGALSFTAALLGFAEAYRPLFGYLVEWHVVRLRVISALTFAVCTLLPLFLVLDLQVRRPLLRMAAFVPLLIVAMSTAPSYDQACLAMFVVTMIASVAIVMGSIPRRRWGALPATVGVAALTVALAAGGFRFGDRTFFIGFLILIVSLLTSLSIDLRRSKRHHDAAQLRAARLEAELLKKSIQPHFVMNTLTAVMEWIEENPKEGVRFLESLADELRIFLQIATQPLIPLRTELQLCEAHLRVMSCRKGTAFHLETDGIREHESIPPAVFHTLLENAISHNSYEAARVSFRLREEQRSGSRRYVFSAPMRPPDPAQHGGVGMRYVATRLEESYPGRWRVDSFADGEMWQTAIEVPS